MPTAKNEFSRRKRLNASIFQATTPAKARLMAGRKSVMPRQALASLVVCGKTLGGFATPQTPCKRKSVCGQAPARILLALSL